MTLRSKCRNLPSTDLCCLPGRRELPAVLQDQLQPAVLAGPMLRPGAAPVLPPLLRRRLYRSQAERLSGECLTWTPRPGGGLTRASPSFGRPHREHFMSAGRVLYEHRRGPARSTEYCPPRRTASRVSNRNLERRGAGRGEAMRCENGVSSGARRASRQGESFSVVT